MILDPLAQQIGAGGALFLASMGLLFKFRPWESHSGNREGMNGNSGEMPVSYWRQEFREAVRDELVQFEKGRFEKIREIVREELDRR